MSIFSQRLNAARRLRGLSQFELARKARLQRVAISLFETGRRSPSFENLKRLANALDVTADYLMGRSNSAEIFGKAASQLFRYADKLSSEDFKVLHRVAEDLARDKS